MIKETAVRRLFAVLLLSVILSGACGSEGQGFSVFHDMVKVREKKSGFPAYSDVSMRSLTIRDVPMDDEKNVFTVAPTFHVTRIDWSYLWFTTRELEAVKRLQALGYTYGGTAAQHIPCWVGDMAPVDWLENIIMTDIEGNPSVMPFIRTWKNPQLIGDISNPAYYDGHLEFYKKLIDAGCDLLQRDAANHHSLAVSTCGGGFTKTGVARFSKWLAENLTKRQLNELGIEDVAKFDYKQYLLAKKAPVGDDFARKYNCPIKPYWFRYWDDLSIEFFSRLVKDCKDYAGRDIMFGVNNTSFQRWDALDRIFDMGVSELMLVSANPQHLRARCLAGEGFGKFQIIGSAKTLGLEVSGEEKTALDTKVITTLYANGAIGNVPWDTFEQTKDGGGRFFGKPVDYAPIFGFIRGCAQYLDGYERAFDYISDGNAERKTLYIDGTDNEVCAFVRVNAKQPAAPVVIHLVDWGKSLLTKSKAADCEWELASGEKIYEYVQGMENLKRTPPAPFELVIDKKTFNVPAEKLTFELLAPTAYNGDAHKAAEQTKDYTKLVSRQKLTAMADKETIRLQISKLSPWAILLVK